jgi:hypothetical protein
MEYCIGIVYVGVGLSYLSVVGQIDIPHSTGTSDIESRYYRRYYNVLKMDRVAYRLEVHFSCGRELYCAVIPRVPTLDGLSMVCRRDGHWVVAHSRLVNVRPSDRDTQACPTIVGRGLRANQTPKNLSYQYRTGCHANTPWNTVASKKLQYTQSIL